jgi:DNA gyrase subunit A
MAEERIQEVSITDEMQVAYIDYAMSVIVSRAIPDVRDGLKPVHRRILYAMSELGLYHNRPFKKSARIVGEVLGKYHPHGDAAVYETLVRMAQPWSLRYPLIDGQGNFGSIDGDNAAAMRYTEARLAAIAEEMLKDIELDTVDFQPNFDDSLKEPVVLPSRIPQLLMNGTSGIAVGMATNMPPHNLSELVEGIIAYIDNNAITIEELMQYIKAPDFPTGGIIYGYKGVKEAYATGKGQIVIRGRAEIEEQRKKPCIIIREIPYLVNKAQLIEKIAQLRDEKKIDGIGEIRDESDRDGIRVVIELKKDAIPQVVFNQLYAYTPLQTTFNVNNVVLVNGRPRLLNLKELIQCYVEHRHEVVLRRTRYLLKEAEQKAHLLEGLIKALDHLDEVIRLIRESTTPDEAKEKLIAFLSITEIQAKAILDMRLQRLTSLESQKLREEYQQVLATIADYKEILASYERQMGIIKAELREIQKKYGDSRRTEIMHDAEEISVEDVIPDEEVIITLTHAGYIKRTPLSHFRVQKRGGKGSRGAATNAEDFVEFLFHASNHDYLLFFTRKGKCYWLRTYDIPEGGKDKKGRSIQNFLQLESDDKILSCINVRNLMDAEAIKELSIFFATRKGVVKRTALEEYARPRSTGIIALNLNAGDELVTAQLCRETDEVLLVSRLGNAVRFDVSEVRPMGRNATGVKGMELESDEDFVVMMMIIQDPEKQELLTLSKEGYGKRTPITEYRKTRRGAKGVIAAKIDQTTGPLCGALLARPGDHIMIITAQGNAIRLSSDEIPLQGRATRGVRIIRLNKGDAITDFVNLGEDA